MNVALLAHDNKKKLMENLCIAYRYILIRHTLFATGTTGQIVEQAINIPIKKYLPGLLGGEQQLGSQITHNDVDLVIFLRDPLHKKQNEPEIGLVHRLCDVYNIPLASNLATAEALLQALDRGDLDWRLNIGK
ncbi:MAG: methylglyoxal synthase [Turicibacter sp.]|nr:methylglyoxal synthase [Turicibacter sp.]